MAVEPGSTLRTATAFPVGTVPRRAIESLSLSDRIDTWKFTVRNRSSFNLNLNGLAARSNADVALLNSAGRVVARSRNAGNRAEFFNNLALEAGTFYVQVQLQPGSAATRYAMTLSARPQAADQFGNDFNNAIPVNLGTAATTVQDFIGGGDSSDFLRFTLTAPGRLNLNLGNLSADANLELYDSSRRLIAASTNGGLGSESMGQRLIDIGSTYYIRVAPSSGSTNYSLSYSLTPDPRSRTASGLQFVDLVEGTGALPPRGRILLVHYTRRLEDGTKFDSSRDRSRPFNFQFGAGQVIAGWEEGLSTMRVGGKRQLIIPPALGYGATGVPGSIPPNATLFFDVELLGIF